MKFLFRSRKHQKNTTAYQKDTPANQIHLTTMGGINLHLGSNCLGTVDGSSGEFLTTSPAAASDGNNDDESLPPPEEISRHLALYNQPLLVETKAVSIDLIRVHCFFSNKRSVVVGLQTVHTVGYDNGKLVQVASDCNAPKAGVQCTTLELELGEYVVDVRVHYGNLIRSTTDEHVRVVKGITLTTQRGRVVTLGEQTPKKDSTPEGTTTLAEGDRKKVIALAARSTLHGRSNVASEVVFYTQPTQATEDEENKSPTKIPSFTMHDRSSQHRLSKDTPLVDAHEILQRGRALGSSFSDLGFYQSLRGQQHQEQHPVKVELKQVQCYYRHKHSIVGVFGVYQSTFANGAKVESQSIDHDQQTKLWNRDPTVQLALLTLVPSEFAINLQVRQQKGVLTVVTNQRTVFLGSSEQEEIDWHNNSNKVYNNNNNDFHHRIVAVAGMRKAHQLSRISFVTESRNWEIAGPLITTRALVQQGRADNNNESQNNSTAGWRTKTSTWWLWNQRKRAHAKRREQQGQALSLSSSSRDHQQQRVLLERLIAEAPDDIFGEVVSFLVPINA
ncbi:expressed unknown protein [Seminavis robusta]|uniref:Jacalin-type lectin domain-containing protein n=1 Tax=Seminavis robusta TaxID=568900 RepID=A0A9N8HMC7_9STRA|nr:expressed unknown protein [Seminavis robusta]|eukprot:Sro1104_g241780.1 n/a (559) ;mRNA; r:6309-7985